MSNFITKEELEADIKDTVSDLEYMTIKDINQLTWDRFERKLTDEQIEVGIINVLRNFKKELMK